MPGYRAHLSVAALLYVLVALCTWSYYTDIGVQLIGFFCVCVGALFPDIDIKSKGQHYLYRFYAIALVYALGMRIVYGTALWTDIIVFLAIVSIAPMLAHHRGITHNPRFIVLVGMLGWIAVAGLYPACASIAFFYSSCFIAGALSHVWLDRRRVFF